jgi:hypothetical protein
MYCLLYILTGSAFYWLSYRNAPFVDDNSTTHPNAPEAEVIYLFPEEGQLRAA